MNAPPQQQATYPSPAYPDPYAPQSQNNNPYGAPPPPSAPSSFSPQADPFGPNAFPPPIPADRKKGLFGLFR
jgi:hypothetical protein